MDLIIPAKGSYQRMSFGISCPPGYGHCSIRGDPDPYSGTIKAVALLRDSTGKVIAQTKYEITEDFIDDTLSQMPEGLYISWLPISTGGQIEPGERKVQSQKNFQHLIQFFFCNHAFANLALGQVASGDDSEFKFYRDDIDETFKFEDKSPDKDDFMQKIKLLSGSAAGKELLNALASPQIAIYYKVSLREVENFLSLLATEGFIEECSKRTGYRVPYGSGNSDNVRAGIKLTKEGLKYQSSNAAGEEPPDELPKEPPEKPKPMIEEVAQMPATLKLSIPPELHACFDEIQSSIANANWNACLLLLRKIVDNAIHKKFDDNGMGDDLKTSSGNFVMLEQKLQKAQGKNFLQPRECKNLHTVLLYGNETAHNYKFDADSEDVRNALVPVRIFLQTFFK